MSSLWLRLAVLGYTGAAANPMESAFSSPFLENFALTVPPSCGHLPIIKMMRLERPSVRMGPMLQAALVG